MKKILYFIMIIFLCSCHQENKVTVFYPDIQIMKLVPMTYEINSSNTQKQAQFILNKISEGIEYNKSIIQLIPKEKNSMIVKIRDNIAYVDFSESSWDKLSLSYDFEKLYIYQIVNSLCALDGIYKVQFSVEGKTKKHPGGKINTKDYLLPDYDI